MLRLGCDLDGVLADLDGALLREARRLFPDSDVSQTPGEGETGDTAAPDEQGQAQGDGSPALQALALTRRQQSRLWSHVRHLRNFWESLDEIEAGAVARLASLARARRWEVIFLTSRPHTDGDSVQVQSQRWLEHCGFSLPSVFVVQTSRGKIADALRLDVVIDDRPENCLDVVLESKARAILVWRSDESTVPSSARRLGIGGVPSVGGCLDLLARADGSAGDEAGLMDRLKRLLGLKSSEQAAEILLPPNR